MNDMWTEINDEVPKYMAKICQKYGMKCQKIADWETAMYNAKCCLIIVIERDDVDVKAVMREDGQTKEYACGNFFAKKYDAADRVDLIMNVTHNTEEVRNALSITAKGLDSKWSAVLEGDKGWFDAYKQSKWFAERKSFVEARNQKLNAILDSMEALP